MTIRSLWGLLASAVLWSQNPATLPGVFNQNIGHWETLLDKGLSTSVRKEVLIHLEKRKPTTSSDPNETLALIALQKVLSRAFILEGNWEEGLRHLNEALESSRDNIQTVEEVYAKLKNDNEIKIKTSKESIDKYNPYLQDLQSIRQLTPDQKNRKQELEVFLSDQRNAVTQCIKNIETMNETLMRSGKKKMRLLNASSIGVSSWSRKSRSRKNISRPRILSMPECNRSKWTRVNPSLTDGPMPPDWFNWILRMPLLENCGVRF